MNAKEIAKKVVCFLFALAVVIAGVFGLDKIEIPKDAEDTTVITTAAIHVTTAEPEVIEPATTIAATEEPAPVETEAPEEVKPPVEEVTTTEEIVTTEAPEKVEPEAIQEEIHD